MEALREILNYLCARVCPFTSGTYETRKTGEGRAFVVTFKHTLNGVEEPSLYARALLCWHLHLPLPSKWLLTCPSLCNDFKPDADSPRSFICVTEMTEKGDSRRRNGRERDVAFMVRWRPRQLSNT
jgi:hypothetical protein